MWFDTPIVHIGGAAIITIAFERILTRLCRLLQALDSWLVTISGKIVNSVFLMTRIIDEPKQLTLPHSHAQQWRI